MTAFLGGDISQYQTFGFLDHVRSVTSSFLCAGLEYSVAICAVAYSQTRLCAMCLAMEVGVQCGSKTIFGMFFLEPSISIAWDSKTGRLQVR